MARTFDRWLAGAGGLIALLVATSALTLRNTHRLYEDAFWVAHTHEVIGGLENVLSLAKDAETGQRGYLITGLDQYLAPHAAALAAINTQVDTLEQITGDNPSQQARFPLLREQISSRLKILQEAIDLRKNGDASGANAVITSGRGLQQMDALRETVGNMIQHERDLLEVRSRATTRRFRTAVVTSIVSGLAGVAGLVAFMALLRRHLAAEVAAAREIAEQRERLRTTLASIGDGVITTDVAGLVTNLNAVAEELTGWQNAEALGQDLGKVFHIVNEDTRQPVENPANKALQQGIVVGLANHTSLISKDGTERPIDDSAAPIRCKDGEIVGSVLVFRDVSDRRESERTLRQSENRKTAMFQSALDCIINMDHEGKIVEFNAAAERVFGYRREDVLGRELAELIIPPHLRDRHRRGLTQYLASGEGAVIGQRLELIAMRADGSEFPVELTVTRIPTEDPPIFTGFVRDLLDRKLAEGAMARLGAVIESSDDAIITKDLNSVITSWNSSAERLFGYTAQEAIGQSVTLLMPPDRIDEEPGILDLIRRGKRVEHYETVRRAKDGTLLNISLSVSPVFDSQGRVVGASKIARDITDHKRAAEAVKKHNERLHLLWESAGVLLSNDDPDALLKGLLAKLGPHLAVDTFLNYVVDESGSALRLARCAGIPEAAIPTIERLPFGEGICGVAAQLRESVAVSEIQSSDDPRAAQLKSFGLRACVCYPLTSDNLLLGTLSFGSRSRDQFDADDLAVLETVSHYVAGAYERLRLLDKLQVADRLKDEFLATLAHELRGPLAPLSNMLEIMKRADGDGELLHRARDMLERQTGQLVRLVDDLLDVSRITRNKLELRPERVELASVLHRTLETCRPLAESLEHNVTLTLPPEPIYLQGDPVRLAQIFGNLFQNAYKYTEPKGRVVVEVLRQGGDAVITVKDNGIGIPTDKLSSIFAMFTQVDQSMERSQGGLGIGLTLVQRLVEMHGGTIEAFSEGQGRGSEFVVRLPALVDELQVTAEPEPNAPQPGPPSRRILVVDDNPDSAASLAMLLKITGHQTFTAFDGQEAVEAAERFRPDVVLLDIGLPKLNGYEACRFIREQPWSKDMLLVALTGWGQEEDRRKTKAAGFHAHLVKPVDFTALRDLLAEDRLPVT